MSFGIMKLVEKVVSQAKFYYFLSIVPIAIAVGVLFWLWTNDHRVEPPPVAGEAETSAMATAISPVEETHGDAFGLVEGLATPWAVSGGPGDVVIEESPTATATERPPVSITLQGPPGDNIFRLKDTIMFYWNGPSQIAAGQRYSVYLIGGDERISVGSASWANLGKGYQMQVKISDFIQNPGKYGWVVALEEINSGEAIGQSEVRPITLKE